MDPPSQAEAPDETIDPKNLPSWMRRPLTAVRRPRADEAVQLEMAEDELIDAPSPDELAQEEVDLERLPRWMRGLPEHGPPDEVQLQAELESADVRHWVPLDE